MKNVWHIWKKEFRAAMASPSIYVFLVVFLAISQWMGFSLLVQAELSSFFALLPVLLLFFAPALTMRSWAEERKLGTLELLMTMPIRDYEAVCGKFLGVWLLLTLGVLLTFPLPLIVSFMAVPEVGLDWGPVIGSYLGTILLGATYLAIGLFTSSLCENQIVAFILTVTIVFLFAIVGTPLVVLSIPEPLQFLAPLFGYLSLFEHFGSIARGVIDTRDVVYYVSVAGIFLYLNICFLERRR